MTSNTDRYKTNGLFLPLTCGLLLVVIAYAGFAPYASAEDKLSEYHALNINPTMKKKLGPKVVNEVVQFFQDAERAIENADVDALMALYSDGYSNGRHDKSSAKRVWKRIFDEFDGMATIHNMRLDTYSSEGNVIIIKCSGLLLGKPLAEKELITIDSWTNESHILTREAGKWRLVGTSGRERKRFWFDKPMHPLF